MLNTLLRAALIVGCLLIPGWATAEQPRPNIVFILADDLGINDLNCYGRKDQATPHLDQLAAQGLRFTSSYCAQPICSPSRAAIMTGKAPARLHLTTYLPGRPNTPAQKLLHPQITMQLPLEERTLAEYLRDAGYATACIGKWHLGGKGSGPAEQGFDFVHAGKANTVPSKTEGGKGEYDLTEQAIRFVEQHKDRPFFLYLPHNNPHIPLAARADLVEKYRGSFHPLYAAVIHTLDDSVGRLLAKLDELKLTENTIVIFTSDNGGLHVLEYPETPATHNTPYRAGKGFVYEGGTRIPTIVRWPNRIAAGKVSDVPFSNTDWLPTLLELCGVQLTAPVDGQSIAALLAGKTTAERTIFWHFPHYTNQGSRPAGAVREGQWKLVEHYDTGELELYNLADDIGETTNLAPQRPELVETLRARLADWRDDVGAQENKPNPEFREDLFQRLYAGMDISKLQPADTAAEMRPALQEWRTLMNSVLPKRK